MIVKVKGQGSKVKGLIKSLKFLILTYTFTFYLLPFTSICYAKEITILYTGETHAMLYPCDCPKEPDGGVARRTTLIKQLRKNNPNTLFLDSGGFFAGGLMDEYTQNTELDRERTRVNLKAMELMRYDAVVVGDDEFNFGREFLEARIKETKINFLSCNIGSDKVLPYTIKEIAATKIGIIGVTGLFAMQKAEGLKFIEPKIAVKKAVEELKKNAVDLIVLLSHLGENDDLRLLNEVEGIDVLIVGHTRDKAESSAKIGSTIVLRPAWQGKRLGKLSLVIEENKIKNYTVEELRLSDKLRDDPDILAILPHCFSDRDCKEKGLIGACIDAGKMTAACAFSKPQEIKLLIVTPKLCDVCNTKSMTDYLKKQFPGLAVSYLYHPGAEADKLIKDFGVKGLPIYLLAKEIEKEKGFDLLKDNLERKGDFYLLKPRLSGVSYFLERKRIKGKLDLFISLYDKNIKEVLKAIKDFNPAIHFLAVEKEGKFDAARGNPEIEEYFRTVCVEKHYPRIFWDYITCRANNIGSSWWEDCLGEFNPLKIKTCARDEEGKDLLRENISLNKELEVMFGPVYLMDNQEVFGTEGVPSKEGLKKILKR